jgi:ABC-type multidrug transport system fused ATPase/permease subunit
MCWGALDNATEVAVMAAVRRLSGQKASILVAHRFSTVEKVDAFFVFERGRVVASGAYETLLEANLAFRKLAGELVG